MNELSNFLSFSTWHSGFLCRECSLQPLCLKIIASNTDTQLCAQIYNWFGVVYETFCHFCFFGFFGGDIAETYSHLISRPDMFLMVCTYTPWLTMNPKAEKCSRKLQTVALRFDFPFCDIAKTFEKQRFAGWNASSHRGYFTANKRTKHLVVEFLLSSGSDVLRNGPHDVCHVAGSLWLWAKTFAVSQTGRGPKNQTQMKKLLPACLFSPKSKEEEGRRKHVPTITREKLNKLHLEPMRLWEMHEITIQTLRYKGR